MKLVTATEFSLRILPAAILYLCLFLARSCEGATKPEIGMERAGTNVLIRFTGALQTAEQPEGPFRPVPGARSPWVVPAGAGQAFWRAWLPGVRTIAAGEEHTVALRTDGTLRSSTHATIHGPT